MCAEPWIIAPGVLELPDSVSALLHRYRYFVDYYPGRVEIQIVGFGKACLCGAPELRETFERLMVDLLEIAPELVYYRNEIRDAGLEEEQCTPLQVSRCYPPSMNGPLKRILVVNK